MGILNASMLYAECGETIKMNWMWSSSEVTWCGDSYAWYCDLDDGYCRDYCDDRDAKYEVRPFSAFINGAKAQSILAFTPFIQNLFLIHCS